MLRKRTARGSGLTASDGASTPEVWPDRREIPPIRENQFRASTVLAGRLSGNQFRTTAPGILATVSLAF